MVQQAEIQGFQMIAVRLRWSSFHPEEPDNGGMAVVAAICMRHEGLEKLWSSGFDMVEDSLALPLQQRGEGLCILRLAGQRNLHEALREQAFERSGLPHNTVEVAGHTQVASARESASSRYEAVQHNREQLTLCRREKGWGFCQCICHGSS